MSSAQSRHDVVSRLFLRASELDADRRIAFLEAASAGDEDLRREVESLLDAATDLPPHLHSSELPLPIEGSTDATPVWIGRYRVLDRIGEGGMGVVYRTEQERPVRRTVAIKVLRRSVSSERNRARFELEIQALARMNHRNIARVYEAGLYDDGTPYFSMELVRGEPITRYCDRRRLELADRLELLLQVCAGIQHAHQNAIVHRDLKPSNVLVAVETPGAGIPKIIDFGIAKAVGGAATGSTLDTVAGELLCTPEYMSPEQAALRPGAVDTRTDVHGLGVLFYELLCGATPFGSRWRRQSFDEIREAIRSNMPAPPSDRSTSATAAARGLCSASDLRRSLRGDLDAIVLKALAKDPGHRYQSPAEMADDVRRFKRREPVRARRAGRLYRLNRFVRRHRIAVVVVSAAVFVLLSFATLVARQTSRLAKEREQARIQARAADLSRSFALRMFDLASNDMGFDAKQRMVEDSLAKMELELSDDSALKIEFIDALYRGYEVCLTEEACALIEQALAGMLADTSDDSLGILDLKARFAESLTMTSKLRLAEPLLREVVEQRRRRLGELAPDTLRARLFMGILLYRDRRLQDARSDLEDLLPRMTEVLGPEAPLTLRTAGLLGSLYITMGLLDEGESLLLQTIEITRRVKPDSPRLLGHEFNMARALTARGAYDDALQHLRWALDHGFYFAGVNDDGEPTYRREGIMQVQDLKPLHGHPDFERLLGESGYITLFEAAEKAVYLRDLARVAPRLRRSLAGGFPPERALKEVLGWVRNYPELMDDPEFRAVIAELQANVEEPMISGPVTVTIRTATPNLTRLSR